MCDEDESDLDLRRRQEMWTEKVNNGLFPQFLYYTNKLSTYQRNVLRLLEKRAKAKKETLICKDKDGTKKTIHYTRFAYPGAGEWPATSIQVREAIVLANSGSCTSTTVEEQEASTEDRKPGENNSPPAINSK